MQCIYKKKLKNQGKVTTKIKKNRKVEIYIIINEFNKSYLNKTL